MARETSCRGPSSQHLQGRHEFGPGKAAAEALGHADRQHHRPTVHHMQLKIELPTHVVRLLSERRVVEIGLERSSEQLWPHPADIETRRAEGLESRRRNAP